MKHFRFPLFNVCLVGFCSLWFFSLSSDCWAAKKNAKKIPVVTAKAAIFSNSTQGKRLYGKNVHHKVWPASTVKVMTALIVMEKLPLDKVVNVSASATYVQPSKINV